MQWYTVLCFVIVHAVYKNSVHCARVLGIFPHPGKSHQMVFDPLLKELANRGHQITVATFFPISNHPNYTEINLESLAELRLESFPADVFEYPSWYRKLPIIGSVITQFDQHYALGKLSVSICEKLTRFPPLNEALKKEYDVVIVERFDSACVHGLLEVYGIKAPVIGFSSCSLMPGDAEIMGADSNPAYVPIVTTSFTHRMTFLERFENFISHVILKEVYRNARENERAVIERNYGKKIRDLNANLKEIALLFVNSYFVTNGVYPLVPGIVEIGGIHIDPMRKKIPAHIAKFVNEAEHGVILFSFGSQLSSTSISQHKRNIFIKTFSQRKERFLWKFADSADEGTLVAKNIMQVKWLPQIELLEHPKIKAFISHGGMLGTLEAMSIGKPMIIIPVFADQKLNAAAIKSIGAAEVLSFPNLNEEDLNIALEAVLSERMRENVHRVSSMWHDRQSSPLTTAVYWTERVIKWGNYSQLYSQAKHLAFYQYALLDVLAFVTLLTVFFFAIIFYVFNCLRKLIAHKTISNSKSKIH